MRKLQVTAEIWKEGGMFTAYCPELDVAGCGKTPEVARKNLLEVIGIHLEETKKMGTLKEFLEKAGFVLTDAGDVLVGLRKEIVNFEKLEIPLEAA